MPRSNTLPRVVAALNQDDLRGAVGSLLVAVRELQNEHDRTSRELLKRIRKLEQALYFQRGERTR